MNELKNNMLTKEELEKIEKLLKKIDPDNKTFALTREIVDINKKERFDNIKEKTKKIEFDTKKQM